MSVPDSRSAFKEYCLRKLGKPVIDLNLDDDQIDDRVDEALKYYWDYHFDGSDKIYYKYAVTSNNFQGAIYSLTVANGGISYSNSDTISYSINGSGAAANVVTNANGTITSVVLQNNGTGFHATPTVTINTSAGVGGSITAEVGGWIPMPQNINGVVRIFPLNNGGSNKNMFDIRYQIALNDLYTLTNQSLVPYFINMQQIQFYEQLLVGEVPIRYQRHKNKLYLDMAWSKLVVGEYVLVEAYEIIDPTVYTDVWGDRWLQNYATSLIKKQWGQNLIKFTGVQILGGITFNGEKIYNDAAKEIREAEEDMLTSFALPSGMMIG